MSKLNGQLLSITITHTFESLTKKSQDSYNRTYLKFLVWKSDENIDEDCFSEAVMLEYFYYLQTKYKPSSLWAFYVMLRTTIQRNHKIDINYPEVSSFLKKSAVGFRSRSQTNVFKADDLHRFFVEANDYEYLAVKVIMMFFIYCETRTEVLTKVCVNDVVEHGTVVVIRIPNIKSNDFRSFTLENEYAACVRKYRKLRPAYVKHDRFFLNYRNGKCIATQTGEKKFRDAPRLIASFLGLKDADSYTRFSVCRAYTSNNKKIGGLNSEQLNLERSTEGAATSLLDSSNVAMTSTNTNKICENVEATSLDELGGKSREKYEKSYDSFMMWKNKEKIDQDCFSLEVMLKYFNYLKPIYKPTSLWSYYSMLRAMIQKKHNVDTTYPEIRSLLKATSFSYLPRTCELFRPDDIQRFLNEAADSTFLALKVVVIFSIFERLQADTFIKIDVNDVVEQGSVFVIKIPNAKTNGFRSFTVENKYAEYVKKYKELRPKNISHNRFFITYRNGKCTALPIGKAKLAKTSKIVAKFLKLKNPDNYSLLSFRKNSKKRGRHLLSSVLERCTEEKNSKKLNLEKSNEPTITITSSIDTSTVSTNASNISEEVEETAWDSLNSKSRTMYLRSYGSLMAWKEGENIDKECFSEPVMLQYFNYIKPKYKPTSLWAEYTKLKTTIQFNYDVDISYPELRSFLRKTSSGYVPQKCNVFQADDIRKFLSDADDFEFLFSKVAMIFVIFGGLHAETLVNLQVNDIVEQDSVFVIKVPDIKTNGFRSFIVGNEYAAYVRKYKELRPENVTHTRFFISYRKGECTEQPIGHKRLLNTSKVVAKFLNLEDPENYLLFSFRKKSLKRGLDLSSDLDNYSDTDECIPNKRRAGSLDLLPEVTQEKYKRAYENFLAWNTVENVNPSCFSKDVMLNYFKYLEPKYKPTSLWTELSMLTATIQKNHQVDISYPEVKSFLRKISSGYLPQKYNVFQSDEIRRFLREASDNEFLAAKIIMLFTIYGATSPDELTNVEVEDIIDQDSVISIKITDANTKIIRTFTLENEHAVYVQKYIELRPQNVNHNRFFIHYRDGKCTSQPIGKQKFSRIPKTIAHFLNLEGADNYGIRGLRKHLKNCAT